MEGKKKILMEEMTISIDWANTLAKLQKSPQLNKTKRAA
jgi:hypothetical protein